MPINAELHTERKAILYVLTVRKSDLKNAGTLIQIRFIHCLQCSLSGGILEPVASFLPSTILLYSFLLPTHHQPMSLSIHFRLSDTSC